MNVVGSVWKNKLVMVVTAVSAATGCAGAAQPPPAKSTPGGGAQAARVEPSAEVKRSASITPTSNQFWWPERLDLSPLRQHAAEADPMGPDFKSAQVVERLDPHAVKKDRTLYHYLALVDAIRVGGPRECAVAVNILKAGMGLK